MNEQNLTPWKPGQSGNPKGRPKGSRDEVDEEMFAAILGELRRRGAEAASQLTPAELLKLGAQIMSRPAQTVEHGNKNGEPFKVGRVNLVAFGGSGSGRIPTP